MDENDDQNFMFKILKIWSKTCVFCCKKYPIPTISLILFFLLYLFFPLVFKILIYSSPLVGILLLVHKHFLGINHQKIKQVEDDRKKKFAKSRRSFKSVYGDRGQLIRRNTMNRHDYIDTNDEDKDDDIFSKSLDDLLSNKKAKDALQVTFESNIARRGECSSSNGNVKCNNDKNVYEHNDKPQDYKIVGWAEDDQKNDLDLGLSEAGRNKRLESLMVRRRSRKNLGFEEGGLNENNNNNNKNVQISAVKTTKINPFLEDHSGGKKSPGSAPSSLVTTNNPFDLPYDPHEEKLDLTGDNFHEEFTVGQPKEAVFCRHESFSLGAFPHSVTACDKHDLLRYKDLSDKQKSAIGFETSTLDNDGDNKHIEQDSAISDDSINSNHPNDEGASSEQAVGVLCEEDGTTIKPQETDSYDERKADIKFLQGIKKRVSHAASHSIVSDMQVELSDEETPPTLDDLEIEKHRESLFNSSNPEADSDPIQNNQIHEPYGAGPSSVVQAAPDGLTEVTTGQASVGSSSPKSVLQREVSADPASSFNLINEVQQSDDQARETDSSDNVLHQTNNSGEHPYRDRDNSQDQNVHQL